MAGDFSGNGKLDLAVANAVRSNDVSILMGNGDGTFQPAVNYAVGIDPDAIVAGDFSGDGKLDLAVARRYGRRTTSRSCWATATGRSSPRSITPSGDDPRRDRGGGLRRRRHARPGRRQRRRQTTSSILMGNGDGTFQPAVNYAVGARPRRDRGGGLQRRRHARPGRRELDGQRRLDPDGQRRRDVPARRRLRRRRSVPTRSWRATSTATAGSTWPSRMLDANGVSILLGNGDGTLPRGQSSSPRRRADLGRSPRATSRRRPARPGRREFRRRHRLDPAGQRRRDVPARRAITRRDRHPDAIVAGDFNGDGRLDLAVAGRGSTGHRVDPAGQRRRDVPARRRLPRRDIDAATRSWRVISAATASSTWPSIGLPTTFGTRLDPDGQRRRDVPARRQLRRRAIYPMRSWRGISTAMASSTWPSRIELRPAPSRS